SGVGRWTSLTRGRASRRSRISVILRWMSLLVVMFHPSPRVARSRCALAHQTVAAGRLLWYRLSIHRVDVMHMDTVSFRSFLLPKHARDDRNTPFQGLRRRFDSGVRSPSGYAQRRGFSDGERSIDRYVDVAAFEARVSQHVHSGFDRVAAVPQAGGLRVHAAVRP